MPPLRGSTLNHLLPSAYRLLFSATLARVESPPIQIPLSGPEEVAREGRPSPERPDPDNPPWGIWGALGLLLLSFLLMLVTQVAFLIPYAVRRGVKLDALPEF